MRIGIVSDSHGKDRPLAAAMELFARRSVEAVVHCGDVGSTRCARVLGGAGVPTYVVQGNMDRSAAHLAAAVSAAGVTFDRAFVHVPIDGGRFLAAVHGHDRTLLKELIEGRQFPYVAHGHTHRFSDRRCGAVRVINPGALHNSRSPGYPTAAILDTASDTLEMIVVPK
ncbi:MAG TPA: YfcE family phosphodiesterase [Phycisphaerae bacterium]|nr:YfcE family phosphodiesterase [Phycisphaerae bacterium]